MFIITLFIIAKKWRQPNVLHLMNGETKYLIDVQVQCSEFWPQMET